MPITGKKTDADLNNYHVDPCRVGVVHMVDYLRIWAPRPRGAKS